MERAIRIARQHGLPANLPRWTMVRDPIYGQIMERGWHDGRRAFVQHDDTDVLDASLLLVPLSNFIAPSDPRWISTPDAIADELVSDSLGPETAALLERESRSPAIALVRERPRCRRSLRRRLDHAAG